jgi:uncharacterized lipoprotein YmbA
MSVAIMAKEDRAMKRCFGIVAMLMLLVMLSACAGKQSAAPTATPAASKNANGYFTISPVQLSAMLEKKDFTFRRRDRRDRLADPL